MFISFFINAPCELMKHNGKFIYMRSCLKVNSPVSCKEQIKITYIGPIRKRNIYKFGPIQNKFNLRLWQIINGPRAEKDKNIYIYKSGPVLMRNSFSAQQKEYKEVNMAQNRKFGINIIMVKIIHLDVFPRSKLIQISF